MHDAGIEKFVKRAETAAAQNDLPADLRIATAHEAEEFDLLFSVRRKIGMSAFGRHNTVTGAIPNENGLAEASAGSKECAGPGVFRLAWIQNAIFFGSEVFDAVAGRAKIVHQHDIGEFQFACKDRGVNRPGKIGGAHTIVDDWASYSKARSAHLLICEVRPGLPREFA